MGEGGSAAMSALLIGLGLLLAPQAARAEPVPVVWPLEAWSTTTPTILSGQRIERDSSGRVIAATVVFPPGGEPHGQVLPDHLGGGVLFFQAVQTSGDTQTAFWRGATWTGELEPLARLPVVVERVVAGFDRLYLGKRGDWLGFDLVTRRVIGLEPLPRVPSLDGLAFAGGGTAAVEAPLLGVWATRDGGLSWLPEPEALGLEAEPGVVLETPGGKVRLAADGSRVPFMARPPFVRAAARGDAKRLERALLSGVVYEGSVWSLAADELLEVKQEGGLSIVATQLSENFGNCRGIEHQPRPWFVCSADDTRVFELGQGGLEPIARLPGPRRLRAYGPIGLLFEGPCSGARSTNDARSCWVNGERAQTLTARHPLAWGVGRTRIVALERTKADRFELVVMTGPRAHSHSFSIPQQGELSRLLGEGQWLPELVETAEGFVGWSTRGEEFVGLAFRDGGEFSAGPIQRHLRRSSFARERALLWGAAGFAKETRDGGLTWRELALPFRSGDAELNASTAASGEVEMGCSAAGCVLGRFFRWGWAGADDSAPNVLSYPDFVPVPPPGGGRFRFSCGRPSESRPATRAGLTPVFLGAPASSGFVTPSVDALEELGRFVASGPRDVSWAREGQSQIVFRDPFAGGEVRSSKPTQGLFADALRADEALGRLEPGSSTAVITLSSRGDGGFFLVGGRARVDLFTFAVGEVVERVEGAFELGVRRLLGAARIGGLWYTAHRTRDALSVLRVEAGRLVEFASFPLGGSVTGHAELVAGPGDRVALSIDGDAGLFVYPLDDGGRLGDAVFASHQGARPKTCSADTPGYTVVRELQVAPDVESEGAALDVSRVTARYRIGPGWICLDALSGRSRGPLRRATGEAESKPKGPVAPVRVRGPAVPLTVTDFSGQGPVSRLSCE